MSTRRALLFFTTIPLMLALAGVGSATASVAGHGGGGGSPSVTSLAPDTATPASGASGTIQIQLSGAAPRGGSAVTLTSSNSSALAVPASVTISSGSSSGQFQYTAGTVSSATAVQVTAVLGSSSAAATLTVTPPAPPTLQSVLALPAEVVGGGTLTVLPQLSSPAPAGGALVTLTSSSTLAPVPASVLIAAGSYSAPMSVTTGTVTAITTVTFTASWNGATVSVQLKIDPPDVPTSVSFDPATTNGTNGCTGTVRIATPAPPGGITVTLQSSNPSVASVPPSASIGGAGVAASFTVTTTPVTANTSVTISATAGGTTVTGTLTVIPTPPPAPALQAVTVSPGSVAGGASSTGTATLNVAAPAGGAVVSLVSSNTSAATVPASVTVPAGATSATFTVTTHSVSTTTTVAIGGTYGGAARAALFGVTGSRGSVLPPPPSGVFIEPFTFDPTPEGDQTKNFEITWTGTLENLTLSVVSGQLPPGMTLISPFAPLTADITGVPTTQGLYAFVLKFTGSSGTVFAWPFVWQITPPAPIVISQANFPAGTVGQAYDGGFFYGGGVPPYTWSIPAGALPPGLTINHTTSEVTGTPTTAGSFSFTARVTDSTGAFLDTPETITISP